ncbi:MAG: asparagine synthase (glutamine-hydrolyzing) [Oscillospiraceae bacterium]|jgi:asparagine synthase (glutamine-hydrolysing)|nr:asparagine synthase (glutamine-hydrolyzing) [Oscillospiraceae bacterium]
MCGLAGKVNYNTDFGANDTTNKYLSRACAALTPRGPDEEGTFISAHCVFAHRRLTVIDPEHGKQPMTRAGRDGREYTIAYNGELYNTEELRRELKSRGYEIRGHSDTEILLYSYIAFGEECVKRFNGIFAFAIWDGDRLFMARDPAGVKPFFYVEFNNSLTFGSELKAIFADDTVSKILDRNSIAELTLLGPARRPGSGVYKGVRELRPGEYAVYGKDGGKPYLKTTIYWKLVAYEYNLNFRESVEHIRALILSAIDMQLVSDVPLCCFLSGGLDSSVISAQAAKRFAARDEKLHTFSVDYEDNSDFFQRSLFQPDEDAPWIKLTSEFLQTKHTDVVLSNSAVASALLSAVDSRDLPGMADVDSSLMLFCKEVRKGFPVALSGECADEIFGGYPWFKKVNDTSELSDDNYFHAFPWSESTGERAGLLRHGLLGDTDPLEYVADVVRTTVHNTDCLPTDTPNDRRMRELFSLNYYHFMQVLLERKDRMSMSTGLEVRVPFCDKRIAELAYNIPWEYKYHNSREKGLVRAAMKGLLPENILWRKKSPYPKTHNPAYMSRVMSDFGNLLYKPNRLTEIFSEKALKDLLNSEGKSFNKNWYGQLMTAPQLFAYLIQFERFLQVSQADIQV